MKKIILFSIASLFLSFALLSQPVLYGTTQLGNGNIVEYDVATNYPKIIYSFANDGLSPFTLSELTNAGNGIYYGSTPRGGQWGGGVIFKFDSASRAYTIIYNFNAPIAEFPMGKLLILSDGKLYGTAQGYNSDDREFKQTQGVIFSFNPQTIQLTILHSFPLGSFPLGNLVQGIDGQLYGVETTGIFSYNLGAGTYEKVHTFIWGTNPADPGGLSEARNGKIYGMSANGETQYGAIYSYDPANKRFLIEKNFSEQTDFASLGTLTREYNGLMFGTTYSTIFSFNGNTKDIRPLATINRANIYPADRISYDLTIGYDGKLYGMEEAGIFSFDPITQEKKNIHESPVDLRSNPLQAFFTNDTGLLAVNPSSASYELIKRLNAPLGIIPQSEIIKGSDGNFYGATTKGGIYNYGGIFSFDPVSFTAKMLVDFDFWAIQPSCPLVEGLDKNLYYTTEFGGGPDNYSRLVRYNKSLNKIEILHQFPLYEEGITPIGNGPLEMGEDGNLYGVTEGGGFGIIYRYIPIQNHFEILGTMNEFNSYSIRFGNDGKLYGLNESYFQSFFSFDTTINIFKKIPFQNIQGGYINHRLTMDSAGSFYTSSESSKEIFKFDPVTESFSKIITLDYLTGNKLSSPLMISSKNILYGTTHYREHIDYFEPPAILQLISVDPSNGILTPLTFLEGALTFKPSLLLEEKPGFKTLFATIADTVVNESDLKANVKITLNKPAESSFRLNYKTIPGTATSSGSQKDFIAKSGSVKFSKGSATGTIQIILKKDKIKEPDENFSILLSKPSIVNEPLEFRDSVATVTIKDGERNHTGSHEIIVKGKNMLISHSNNALVAFVYPNPSSNYFTLLVSSKNYHQQIQMIVSDANGRLIETRSIRGYQMVRIGENYRNGIYFVQLIQNNEKVIVKLIKS